MKTTKKLILGLSLALLGSFAHAQTGLTNITVEKYYIANAADAAQATAESTGPADALPAGSVTYRFYADMAVGYKLISVYADGTKSQSLIFNTTTQFYNNAAGLVSPVPGTAKTAIKNNLLALDSYITLGAVASSNYGILKSEDPGGSGTNAINVTVAGNTGGVLLNSAAAMGIALTTQDGLYNVAPAPQNPSFAGFSAANNEALNDNSVTSNSFNLADGSMYTSSGAVGPIPATNRVLIAQITTDGVLHYELNVLVQEIATGIGEYYATVPGAGDFTCPGLSGNLGAANIPPTVSITSPSNGAVFVAPAAVTINANAADSDGSVASVEFFVDGVSVGVDNASPFTATYSPSVAGAHCLTARATDDVGAQTTTACTNITVNGPQPPTVSITAPANGSTSIAPDVIAIAATAADADGTVSSVEFFVDGVSLSIDNTSPYTANYTGVVGSHCITARATDNTSLQTTTACTNITVNANQAPTVSVSSVVPSPAIAGDAVAIGATAADADGSVASVEFFVDGVSLSIDNSSPFTASYTAVVGVHSLTAKATDDRGLQTTSAPVSLTVNPNTPPTTSITAPSAGASFTAPAVVAIAANAADADGTVTNVEFLVNGVVVGSDATSPYSFNWTSVIGSASLTSRATDNKGAQTTSAPVVIDIADPNALPYALGKLTATCVPTTFCLPLSAAVTAPVANVIGYDIILNYDVTKVVPTGNISKYADLNVATNFFDIDQSVDLVNGVINISATINGTAPANTNFNGIGKLICVEFNKIGGFAPSDVATFTISTLNESYATSVISKLASAGTYTTVRDTVFNANLSFWTDNSPIQYDIAAPGAHLITNIFGNNAANTAQSTVSVNPNLSGNFVYNTQNGLYINIERDILNTTPVQSVINGNDALFTRKVLVNDVTPTYRPNAYQAIAMDVNRDGVISAGDVTQINQRAVNQFPEFKQAWNYTSAGVSLGPLSKDWLFIDTTALATAAYQISATYPNDNGVGFSKARVPVVPFNLDIQADHITNYATCPVIGAARYKGIMIGDVDGSYDAIPSSGLLRSENNNDKVVIDLTKAVSTGAYIDVPVSVVSDNAVNALDFAMKFNVQNLSFNSTVNQASYMQAVDHFNINDQTLRFTSNSFQNYDIAKPVVSVRFATVSGKIDQSDLNSLEGYINGRPVKVEVLAGLSGIATANDNLVSIYPNPANEILNVMVTENATVQLLDLSGKLIILQTNATANQKQEINIQNVANGVYLMKVYNDTFISVKKVVINK